MSDEHTPGEHLLGDGDAGSRALSRRESLKTLVGALGSFAAGVAAVPLYRFVASPALDAQAGEHQTHMVVPEGLALAPKQALIFAFNNAPALLIRHSEDQWSCFRAVCTHMSCTVHYDENEGQIVCACHNGVFDARTGLPIQGPPATGLEVFGVSIEQGELVVAAAQ